MKQIIIAIVLSLGVVGVANAAATNLTGYIMISSKALASSPDATLNVIPVAITHTSALNCENAKNALLAAPVLYLTGSNKDQFGHPVRGFAVLECLTR
jgi:hypothetical protein